MRISVRVVPRASRTAVKEENGVLKVYLTRPAQDGQANAQLIAVLADHFQVKKYQIGIVAGQTSRTKIVDIQP
ncbi:MAG TPA: DUF167 domain-containing protein [Candidatus Omnitrophota bacterium]|nr:DUF167 domain-containing protein [Candidatus Omnitrophota bacterium]HRZ15484.1 DUF167 domain-containing protein [Candidatus Omnitrophota bacterium]